MALLLLTTTAFEKDLRRVEKQGKDLDKLEAVGDLLQTQKPLLPAVGPILCLGTTTSAQRQTGTGTSAKARARGQDPYRFDSIKTSWIAF